MRGECLQLEKNTLKKVLSDNETYFKLAERVVKHKKTKQ